MVMEFIVVAYALELHFLRDQIIDKDGRILIDDGHLFA